ncbi:ImmA/IrrE family metallo-endopeptidase [Erythrobacter sp. R86502]|uniref:ImmA/IrrE family metallo-endopeptidase n=1 Tax=Erythrobacter sp. R86502 TaxID=3093846 RepID=UPI0036D4013B
MKLENSQSSKDGLNDSQIVELRHPEERMAARLVERLGLRPPIDVENLCKSLADLEFKRFPIEIDGLCLDLKSAGKKPKVWVSVDIPLVRRRFTLAHEIGHIIIPWHAGTIVDDLEAPSSKERSRYRDMEAEANRFAAELLMPSSWVLNLAERAEDGAALMHSIKEIANVSYPAAFLKAAKLSKPGLICAEVKNSIITRSMRSPETKSRIPEVGAEINGVQMPAAFEPRVVQGTDASYYFWQIREDLEVHESELKPWRQLLTEMLNDIPPEYRRKTQQQINAIIGIAIGREPKGGDVKRIYRRGIEASQNREDADFWVSKLLSHESFCDYVLGRARERAGSSGSIQ